MWHWNKVVVRTHAKNGSQMAWAVISDVGIGGWIRIKPHTADGVMNVFMILCAALANGHRVDVYIQDGQITQANLR